IFPFYLYQMYHLFILHFKLTHYRKRVAICRESNYLAEIYQLNDQLFVIPRIDLHILVAIGVNNHPGLTEHIVERVVCMAVNPEIRAMVDNLVGNVGHEGAIEAVSPEPLMDG